MTTMKKLGLVFVLLLSSNAKAPAGQQESPPFSMDSLAAELPVLATSKTAFERFQKRLAFLDNYFLNFSSASFDTTVSFKVVRNDENPLGLSREELSRIAAGGDYIENQIRRRNTGNTQTFSLGALLAQGAITAQGKAGVKKPSRRLQIIPSENEIRILKTLWIEKQASGGEIYRHMDSVRVTAAGLDEILAAMTDRGLLARRQISPRHEFTFVTPFGALPIEMSGRNRKNREYVYEPMISADEMWTYLDASVFNLLGTRANHDQLLVQHLRRLMQIFASPSE